MLNPFTIRKILKKGIPGRARIQSMTMPPRGASKFNLGMTLRVSVEGRAPNEVEDQWIVSAKTPLGFGKALPVKVDRDDPQRLAVDWVTHLASQDAAKRERRGTLAAMGPVAQGGISEVPTETTVLGDDPELTDKILEALSSVDADAARSPGDETIDALERLAKLRGSGALTEDEFRADKRRILGGG